MRSTNMTIRWMLNLTAVTALLLPQLALAANPSPLVSDVALQDGGVLRGQLVASTGRPEKAVRVTLLQNQKPIAVTETTPEGHFTMSGVRPGIYQIETERGGGAYRLWAPRTAPPSANRGVLLVTGEEVARGQIFGDRYGPAIRGAIAGGLAVGGLIAILDYNPAGS